MMALLSIFVFVWTAPCNLIGNNPFRTKKIFFQIRITKVVVAHKNRLNYTFFVNLYINKMNEISKNA